MKRARHSRTCALTKEAGQHGTGELPWASASNKPSPLHAGRRPDGACRAQWRRHPHVPSTQATGMRAKLSRPINAASIVCLIWGKRLRGVVPREHMRKEAQVTVPSIHHASAIERVHTHPKVPSTKNQRPLSVNNSLIRYVFFEAQHCELIANSRLTVIPYYIRLSVWPGRRRRAAARR